MNVITSLHGQLEEADQKLKKTNMEFAQLEKDDVIYLNEKRQKVTESQKTKESIVNL